jgi:DedD protein
MVIETVDAPAPAPAPAPKPAPRVKHESKPAPKAHKPAPKPAPARKPAARGGSYYIQVGSFSQRPSSRFLSAITNNGFHYVLKGGKLLIGPYKSDAAARQALPRVKSKINKGAFIKHL